MCRKGIFLTTQRAGTAKMPLSSFVLPIIDNGMKAETPSFEAHQFVRVRRGDAVRRLIQRDKTPLAVLLMAAVVGTLAGLVGVAFEKSVNWVQNQRIGALAQVADHWYLVWPLRLSCRRCWQWSVIFSCAALRRRRAAPGSRKSKGRWRSCGRCAGGACCR
ncbi:H(+)/Cl(-) exchange transporter ClcA [Klebsiella variicola]|uniref:H(+)/Cl(-) exchange transporter ClcA n=1 Tax=Klebsiella variicola TaxID=244366 RepID=A0A7H4MDM5_KLEVA|nr:H(+)/Cl(-) exchange transporter ClcA [Klebsiella variicola]